MILIIEGDRVTGVVTQMGLTFKRQDRGGHRGNLPGG